MSSNSAGSTVGRRKRWARTALTGSASTISSPAVEQAGGLVQVGDIAHFPRAIAVARADQIPAAAGGRYKNRMRMRLRYYNSFQRIIWGVVLFRIIIWTVRVALPDFPDAYDAHNLVFESDQAGKLRKLLRCESERKPNLIERFEDRIILRAVDPIGAAAQFEKTIDDLLVESREGEEHIARSPGEIDRAAAVESKICLPVRPRGKFLPALDLFQFLNPLEERVLRMIILVRLRAVQPREDRPDRRNRAGNRSSGRAHLCRCPLFRDTFAESRGAADSRPTESSSDSNAHLRQ